MLLGLFQNPACARGVTSVSNRQYDRLSTRLPSSKNICLPCFSPRPMALDLLNRDGHDHDWPGSAVIRDPKAARLIPDHAVNRSVRSGNDFRTNYGAVIRCAD